MASEDQETVYRSTPLPEKKENAERFSIGSEAGSEHGDDPEEDTNTVESRQTEDIGDKENANIVFARDLTQAGSSSH